ncbi:MAG: DUF1801 domain-containing protein [Candidatus Limnocylindrales bacterium]
MSPDPFPPEALLADYGEPIQEVAAQVRLIVSRTLPDVIEAVRPGWRVIGYNLPLGRRRPFIAWLMVQPEHVHLGFPQGVLLSNHDGALEGAGITKRARWLTAVPGQRVAAGQYASYLIEAARIAGLSRSEQEAIRADRDLQVSIPKPR